jgi:hypothetical protein
LEEQLKEARNSSSGLDLEIDMEPVEEVKKEANVENFAEVAQRLNCDCSNPDELKSLQLALQLEAEERERQQDMNNRLRSVELMRQNSENAGEIDPDSMSYEQLLELEEKIGKVNNGMKQEAISKIPFKEFRGAEEKEMGKKCSICQCDYEEGEKFKELPCKHDYHMNCIDKWLLTNKHCPICKVQLS